MAEVHFCDICGEILKSNIYVLTVSKINKNEREEAQNTLSYEQLAKLVKDTEKKTVAKEICPTCHKVLGMLFKMRLNKLNKLKKEVAKYEKYFKDDEEK